MTLVTVEIQVQDDYRKEWASCVRLSMHDTVLVLYKACRFMLFHGKLLSSSGNPHLDVEPVEDDGREFLGRQRERTVDMYPEPFEQSSVPTRPGRDEYCRELEYVSEDRSCRILS